ncbi:hypothetical protein [Anaerosporobacter sp.]|uniref:hypothetical protein n=1 Tax=Anaerosporobacter sp. TaxID=1872529 RepID=UPI00286F8E28|nr:hypothetical protein [Anaerosporobacter sp.]
MKFTKFIPHYLLFFFLLILKVIYIVDDPLGNKLANIAGATFLLCLVVMLVLNIIKGKGTFKIVFNILKIVLYLVLAYLFIKEYNLIDVNAKERISGYLIKIGCLFYIVFPVETIIDSALKGMNKEREEK